MKKAILPLAVLIMFGVIFAAFAFDCVRIANAARSRVELADLELEKHEERLVGLLSSSSRLSPEVQAAITAHQEAAEFEARHAAYEKLVAAFRQSMSTSVDPTNPLDRKFMDDIAGAINRREVAEKPFNDEFAAYQEFLRSQRGEVASWFSSQARTD